MMKKNRVRGGFTLIEMLVVILVIGILSQIALPQYFKLVERSRSSEALALIRDLNTAQGRFFTRHGIYAASTSPTAPGPFDVDIQGMADAMKYFEVTSVTGSVDGWSISLRRRQDVFYYGRYVVRYRSPGAVIAECRGDVACSDELLP